MRKPTPWTHFPKYPIVAGTILLSVAASLAFWSQQVSIEPLFETVDIRRGQLWRTLTSALPHGNILHLVFNLYWTWFFGTLIEQRFGHLRTLAIFLLFAFIANGAEYAFLDGGIGLSGIGYGLFGLVWILARYDSRFADAINQNTINLFILWFFLCIVFTLMGSPIANIAHGVGALCGVLLGFAIASPPRRAFASATLVFLFVTILVTTTVARPFINLSKNGGYEEGDRGYKALVANHNEEALRWFRDATRMRPEVPSFWFDLGVALERLNRYPEALIAYQRAHNLAPGNPDFALPTDTTEPASHPAQ